MYFHGKGFLLTWKRTAQQRKFRDGQGTAESREGAAVLALPPGHLSHLSQHPPPLHPIQMQLPLPCQPLALNSSLKYFHQNSNETESRLAAGWQLPGAGEQGGSDANGYEVS